MFYFYFLKKFDRNIGIEFFFEPIIKCESKEDDSEEKCSDLGKIFVSKVKENSAAYRKLKFVKYLYSNLINL